MGGLFSQQATMVSEDVKFYVDNTIGSKPVVVFSKTYCPYCTKAKNVLDKYSIDAQKIEVIEIEKRPDCAEIQAYMKEITGGSSVPRVFIEGKFIGGGDDTANLEKTGQLKGLLTSAGAI